jgi:choline-sulfatase
MGSASALRRLAFLTGAVALAVAVAVVLRRGVPTDGEPRAIRPVDTLVLITVDTLRADRVGAYGWARARTPAIDALAARGVRFTHAYATAPITLPSHASLLTGSYPPGHGSRHNGVAVRADIPTLAERLREQGWSTGAFVGAYPLDRRFGLARGFQEYGDRMPRTDDGRPLNERAGRVVVDEALAWLGRAGPERVFVWVHLFEPHAPYVPDSARGPGGASLPAEVRYDDEVAAADAQVARLLAGLGARAATAAIALAGDHGEAFGEHGEVSHSVFLYDTTLRVPLVVAAPGVLPSVVDAAVSLVDVAPTLLGLAGAPALHVDGVSLLPVLQGGAAPSRELYAETYAPLMDFGWSPLRCVRLGRLKYIEAPRPELFDIEADPGENQNQVAARQADAARLADRLRVYAGGLPMPSRATPEDADARRRLAALGYVSSGGKTTAGVPRPDPKDRRDLAARMALAFSGELTGNVLRQALERLAAEDASNALVRTRLGDVLVEAGELRQAEPHFRAAIAAQLPSADPYLGLALCLAATGRPREAERILSDAMLVEPGNPVVEANRGALALEAGRLDAAQSSLARAVELDPDLHQARFNLVRVMARQGRQAAARMQAEDLLKRLPDSAPQRAEVERLLRALQ